MYISILRRLPLVLCAAMLVIGLVSLYLRSRRVTKSALIEFLKGTKYFGAGILAVVIILSGTFAVFNHLNEKKSARAVITLNYSEASKAQNSNGTRYNMAEIICDEVIQKAIKNGAFEDVTVNDLKRCLSVAPLVQGDVRDKSSYHISTEFVVYYYASRNTRHLDADNVIKMVACAYKEYYIEKYTDSTKLYSGEQKPDFSKLEYMDTVSYFDKECAEILNYLYGMDAEASGFVTSSGTTFGSIAGKVYQFKNTQIEENLKSLILQYGIARDKSAYIGRLKYRNTNTDFDRRKNAVSYSLCNQAINMYAPDMTRIVLVPTWDKSGKYYMGRTKVGIDELSVMAADYSSRVASNQKEIMDNNLIIDKMNAASGNSSSHRLADPLIESIDESLTAFSEEAIAAGHEYAYHKMNQCVAVSIYGPSIISEMKKAVIFAFIAYISVTVYAVSREFAKQTKNA